MQATPSLELTQRTLRAAICKQFGGQSIRRRLRAAGGGEGTACGGES